MKPLYKFIDRAEAYVPNTVSGIVRQSPLKKVFSGLQSFALPVEETYTIGEYKAEFRIDTPADEDRYRRQINSERRVIEPLLAEIQDDDVFWDVGANFGIYSSFIGQIASKTVAFDPHPELGGKVRANLRLNDVDFEFFEMALSESTGKTIFDIHEIPAMGHLSSNQTNADSVSRQTEIQIYDGDSLIAHDIQKPSVMKIDVEGAELDVLKGLKDTLSTSPPRLIHIEIHPKTLLDWGLSPKEEKELKQLLSSQGFHLKVLFEENSGATHLRAKRY